MKNSRKLNQNESHLEEQSEDMVMQTLDWAYDKAINGVAGFDSAEELAMSYMEHDCSHEEQADSLIRWQNTKAATSGFLTGLGGIITMPITLPANITSVVYIQIRMIAAIAHLSGHDVMDDRIKSLVYVCLTGNAAKEILKDIGIVIGTKLTKNAIKNISSKTVVAINQKAGFRLLTKFGEKGAINLGKAVPLVGGLISGTFDAASTNAIGNIAKEIFISTNASPLNKR